MQRQRITAQRSSDTSSTPFGDVATTSNAGTGHPDLNQFLNEFAAAPMDAGNAASLTDMNRPPGMHGARASRSGLASIVPRNAGAGKPPARAQISG